QLLQVLLDAGDVLRRERLQFLDELVQFTCHGASSILCRCGPRTGRIRGIRGVRGVRTAVSILQTAAMGVLCHDCGGPADIDRCMVAAKALAVAGDGEQRPARRWRLVSRWGWMRARRPS